MLLNFDRLGAWKWILLAITGLTAAFPDPADPVYRSPFLRLFAMADLPAAGLDARLVPGVFR